MSIDLIYHVQVVVQNGGKRRGNMDVITEAIAGIGTAYSVLGCSNVCRWEEHCEGECGCPEASAWRAAGRPTKTIDEYWAPIYKRAADDWRQMFDEGQEFDYEDEDGAQYRSSDAGWCS